MRLLLALLLYHAGIGPVVVRLRVLGWGTPLIVLGPKRLPEAGQLFSRGRLAGRRRRVPCAAPGVQA